MRSKKNKKSFRIPIALHIYSSMILITLLTVLVIGIANNYIVNSYIASECDRRIDNTISSCQNFAIAFRTSITDESGSTPEEIRTFLLNAIVSSSDLSNDASIVLFGRDNTSETGYQVLWPTESYSMSATARANSVLNSVISEDGIETGGKTKTATYTDKDIYYRFVKVEYSESNDQNADSYDTYYLLIYVDSSSYYSFSNAMHIALLRSIVLSIILAAVASIIVAFPLFHSSRRLARFAGRIGRGDFKPLKGHIVSRELSDLGDVMNKMATRLEKTDLEQKTFFQNASHELRTPLMSIQGYAEGIKYGVFDSDPGKKDEAVDIIINETTRLTNLVENLLSISKMDMSKSGNYEVKKQLLNARELTEMVIEKVRGGFLHSGKELTNDIKIGEIYIYANENDIFRMFENIFSNCLRYAKSTVSFCASKEGSNIIFRISDDGPGISDEVLKDIFTRFAKGSDGKHGIGLALARSIAEEHNGSIKASNLKDDDGTVLGASFEIILPVSGRTDF